MYMYALYTGSVYPCENLISHYIYTIFPIDLRLQRIISRHISINNRRDLVGPYGYNKAYGFDLSLPHHHIKCISITEGS
jgi:hypothetical protein